MNLAELPKVELHLHLDCSLSLEAARALDPAISAEHYRQNFVLDEKVIDLSDFLRRVPHILGLMQTGRGIRVAVSDLFKQLQADKVIYAEIRFAPLQHLETGLTPEAVVAHACSALEENIAATGIEARLLLCTLRHFSEEQGMATVKLAEKFREHGVAGLDLAADEAGFPIQPHRAAFRYARRNNIPCTAHAGEACGAESVWETLQELKPARIGHGVRSIEDKQLLRHLRDENIHLEVCPTCNVLIDVFPDYPAHPVNRLYQAGVSLGINTDGRTLPQVTLNQEYRRLQETFGWTEKDFYHCNLNALNAAFIPESTKAPLREKLRKHYQID